MESNITQAIDARCKETLAVLYGNPYFSMNRPAPRTLLYNEFLMCGHRRSLGEYPWFVSARSGNIVISERDGHRLQFFDPVGHECRFEPFGHRGHGQNEFESPGGVTTTNQPHAAVIVADTGNRRICLYSVVSDYQGYGLLEQTHEFGHHMFKKPLGIEYDSVRDQLVVVDGETRRVSIHDLCTGVCIGEFCPPRECPLLGPVDVAMDEHGLWYVTDSVGHRVHVYEHNGAFVGKFGSHGKGDGQFDKPWGCCFDREFNLLISDECNNRVVMHAARDRSGIAAPFVKVITTDVYSPKGVAINIHQNLVVVDGTAYNFVKIFKYK